MASRPAREVIDLTVDERLVIDLTADEPQDSQSASSPPRKSVQGTRVHGTKKHSQHVTVDIDSPKPSRLVRSVQGLARRRSDARRSSPATPATATSSSQRTSSTSRTLLIARLVATAPSSSSSLASSPLPRRSTAAISRRRRVRSESTIASSLLRPTAQSRRTSPRLSPGRQSPSSLFRDRTRNCSFSISIRPCSMST